MNVASLEHCRKLHELSGWGESTFCYKTVLAGDELEFRAISLTEDADVGANARFLCPAYDLGYLMRKLQPARSYWTSEEVGPLTLHLYIREDKWCMNITSGNSIPFQGEEADTPEDAACKLLIELFKQQILTKE